MTENKFSKYLLYAIGEIVLVVIGILIALGVNNWNKGKNLLNKLVLKPYFPRPIMTLYQSIIVKEEIPPEYINDYVLRNLSTQH